MADAAAQMDEEIRARAAFWRTMPKPDMHVHLVGAARASTVLELAEKNERVLRDSTLRLLGPGRFFEEDYSDFVETFREIRDCFVTPEDLERLAWEVLEDAASDGVRYVDARLNWQFGSAQRLTTKLARAVESGRRSAQRAFGIASRVFIDFPGWEDRSYAEACVKFALAHRELGILGVDMVGLHNPIRRREIGSLNRASAEGLCVVAHAGEVGGIEEIRDVLRHFPVRRIAHALAAAQDTALLKHLAEQQIVIEVCPGSNLHTRRIQRIEDHPARIFVAWGIPIVVASDDPMLFRTTLSEQYALLETRVGLSTSDLLRACKLGIDMACLGADEHEMLREAFEAWCREPGAARSLGHVPGNSCGR